MRHLESPVLYKRLRGGVLLGAGSVVALVVAACSENSSPTANLPAPPASTSTSPPSSSKPPVDYSCDAMPDPRCDNPINRVVIPLLRAANLPIRDADPQEVCRRMAVDLVGRVPTAQEAQACKGMTPAQMADLFMGQDDYARTQARAWGEQAQYDIDFTWPNYTADLDGMVRDVYRGKLGYADFAARFVIHPAYLTRHFADDWTTSLFNIFLGRPARADELAGMRPLTYSFFYVRYFCAGYEWYITYQFEKQSGLSEADAMKMADQYCNPRLDMAFDECGCYPYQDSGTVGCTTSTLGKTIDLGKGEGCANQSNPYDAVNMASTALIDPSGRSTTCPDGVVRDGCANRELTFAAMSMTQYQFIGPITPMPAPTDVQKAKLLSIGDALAARRDFWEAEADREVLRFTGWWKQGFRRPDYDLPDVRAVLADALQKGTSVRDAQKLVVTSLLYTQPADRPAAPANAPQNYEAPIWSMGPTKFLGAESWLDSAGVVVGETLGSCDYRFMSSLAYDETYYVEPQILESKTPTLINDWPYGSYLTTGQQLGGCTASQARPRFSSVGITYSQHATAQLLCARGSGVLPSGFVSSDTSDGALQTNARAIVGQALARSATDAEATQLASEMRACLDAGASTGCQDAEAAARWLCQRLIDSAEFALY